MVFLRDRRGRRLLLFFFAGDDSSPPAAASRKHGSGDAGAAISAEDSAETGSSATSPGPAWAGCPDDATSSGILASGIRLATPYLFAAICETLGQRSGVLNLGVEGTMYAGAFFGFAVAYQTGDAWIGLLGAFATLILRLSTRSVSQIEEVQALAENRGTDTLVLLAIGVVANDVGALFIGSAVGSTPLRRWISPNKTVEGAVAALIGLVLALYGFLAGDGDDGRATRGGRRG